jgi:hypothetical protein
MYWIEVPQDRDGGRTIVKVVINLQVPENARNF